MQTETQSTPTLFTVNSLVAAEPHAFSRGGLRHLIFHHGEQMQADGVIVRMGAKILIDRPRLVEWLRQGNASRGAA